MLVHHVTNTLCYRDVSPSCELCVSMCEEAPPVHSQSAHPPVSRVCVLTLRAAVVRVVCLVVHHQLIVHKVEAVGLRLIRVQDHLSNCEQAQKHHSY